MQKIKEGVYLVDKPSGPSSHAIVNYFRRLSGIKRVGHCGTLDPFASGLLIILVGREFTKTQDLYLKKDKEYLASVKLGVSTDTYDRTGQITQEASWSELAKIDKKIVEKTLERFKGKIQQTVPIFSAVKIGGEKLYYKARKGESIALPSRNIEIKKLKLKNFKKDVKKEEITFDLEVICSSGTYIRSLVHDLGLALKVGANVQELRRLKIDKFHVKKAIKIKMDSDNRLCQ